MHGVRQMPHPMPDSGAVTDSNLTSQLMTSSLPVPAQPRIIAIASGKGGTGKTTVAVGLALAATESVVLMDCDVEEPNGHLFLHPIFRTRENITLPVPVVDDSRCDGCSACRKMCQFGAIAILKGKAHVFSSLCHSCGGCALVCPKQAIHEEPRELGFVEEGDSGNVRFVRGTLNVGQPLAPAVIRAVKRRAGMAKIALIDSPPGTACAMVAAVRGSDEVLLVTEPTPFGLHDLKLAVSTVRALGIPLRVIINRAESEEDLVSRWCFGANIEICLRIPGDRRIAEAYSRGEPITQAAPSLIDAFRGLLARRAP